ncbi:MFS transporter [Arthrobacter sp. RIT-PI-e]|uniref:MFS transporter n=1 Tax=Arthrobacter sp. RIT-PI-e TaxID=1681197 RepID=UPI002E0E22EB
MAGPSFLVIGLFARLPLAMLTIGALTLVTSVSGSYAAGGFAAGAVGIGSALGAPLVGLLADQRGQRAVLLGTAVLNPLAVVAVLLVTLLGSAGSLAPVLAVSFVMGFTCPQIGPLARVRWMAMTQSSPRSTLDTALSYESTADETTFVLGPALVGLLAGLIAPWLPLVLAAVLTATLVPAFAVHRTVSIGGTPPAGGTSPVTAEAPAASSAVGKAAVPSGVGAPREAVTGRRRTGLVLLPVAGMLAMGTFFGSTQSFLNVFAGSFGAQESAGLLYAVMGLSSAVAALSVAYWPRRLTSPVRWVASAAGMVLAAGGLLVTGSVPAMLAVLLLLGIFVGPTMVTVFSIGSVVAPARRLGTVMTFLASGIVAGTALGSATAGSLAETAGAGGAALVPGAAALVLLLLGAVSVAALRSRGTDR